MHEEALLNDLRRKVEELSSAHGGARIVRARVALGALSHLDERRLRELWDRAMAGGPAANAPLEVELLPSIEDERAGSLVLRSVTFAEPASPAGSPGAAKRPPSSSSPGR